MLKVMTACYGGNSFLAENLRPLINSLGMQLFTLHEWDSADIKWELGTWLGHMSQADIVICPANYKIQPEKSANRLTQAMALGKPVICSPLRAYLEVLQSHPGSCIIADTPEEWKEKLTLLRDNPSIREEISKKALVASQDYSIDAMGKKWADLFCGMEEKRDPVDIIITTYNNPRYLELCLDSIIKNTDIDFNIIISDAGSNEAMWIFLKELNKKYISTKLKKLDIFGKLNERKNYSETCNYGILKSTSKYFVILNSDVIVSKGWLGNMLEKMVKDKKLAACGVLSNCDRGWLF